MSNNHNHSQALPPLTPGIEAIDFTSDLRNSVRGQSTGDVYDDSAIDNHISRHRVGIGRSAVLSAYDQIDRAIVNGDESIDDRQVFEQVDAITFQLAALDGRERFATNVFIGSHLSNEWLFKQLGIPKDEQGSMVTDYVQYLTATNPETSQFAVGQRTRLNFLELYNAQLAVLTKEAEASKPVIIQQFKRRFKALAERGIIPESALDNLERLENLELVVDDGPVTSWQGILGTYRSNRDAEVIHITPSSLDSYDDPERSTITHELIHAMSGGREDTTDTEQPIDWHRRDVTFGFERRFGFDEGSSGQLLNEAITEYLTLAAINENESYDSLRIANGAYGGGRQLLATLSSFGVEKIPMRYFTDVHFAKSEDVDRAIDRLNERLTAAFPGVSNSHGDTIVTLLEILSNQTLHDA